MTIKEAKAVVRANMDDKSSVCYVPVQKFTLAMSMLLVAKWCRKCKDGDCKDCTIRTLGEKLKESIVFEPMFDENFNLLDPPKGDKGK